MKIRVKKTGLVREVDSVLGNRLLGRSEGSYELVIEESKPVAKTKKKDENTKSERGSSDSQ